MNKLEDLVQTYLVYILENLRIILNKLYNL